MLFPIQYPKIWSLYKSRSKFLDSRRDRFSKDLEDWDKLSKGEKHFIKNILAFFAGSDGIVLENLTQRFTNEIQIPESKMFLWFSNGN